MQVPKKLSPRQTMQRQICRKEVLSVINADASRRGRGALNHANLAKDHQTAQDSINQGRKEAYRTCKQQQAEMRLRHQAGSRGQIDGHEPILSSHHERKKKKKKKRKKRIIKNKRVSALPPHYRCRRPVQWTRCRRRCTSRHAPRPERFRRLYQSRSSL